MDRRRGMRLLSALLVLLGAAPGAQAQCAMCGSATPYAGSSPERVAAGFVVAALVLLVPVFALLAALAVYLWRRPGDGTAAATALAASGAEPVDGAPGGRVLSWPHATSPGEAGL